MSVLRLMRAVDQQQAQSPTSVSPADILSPSSVTDEKRNIRKGGRGCISVKISHNFLSIYTVISLF